MRRKNDQVHRAEMRVSCTSAGVSSFISTSTLPFVSVPFVVAAAAVASCCGICASTPSGRGVALGSAMVGKYQTLEIFEDRAAAKKDIA